MERREDTKSSILYITHLKEPHCIYEILINLTNETEKI